MDTNKVKIYVPLLNEGTDVIRPTEGYLVRPGIYVLLPTPDYDPACEEWAFLPGSMVSCGNEIREGKQVTVAQRLA